MPPHYGEPLRVWGVRHPHPAQRPVPPELQLSPPEGPDKAGLAWPAEGIAASGGVAARTPASGLGRPGLGQRQTHSDPVPVPGPAGQTTLPFSAPGSFWEGRGPRLPRRASARPVSSWGPQGTSCHEVVVGRMLQEYRQDEVAEGGLEEMPLSCWPGQARGVWAAGTGRGRATPLTKQGAGVSFRKRPSQNRGPPSPKGGAREGTHTCLSYARNAAPQPAWGRSLPGGQGLGRGLTSKSRKTL